MRPEPGAAPGPHVRRPCRQSLHPRGAVASAGGAPNRIGACQDGGEHGGHRRWPRPRLGRSVRASPQHHRTGSV